MEKSRTPFINPAKQRWQGRTFNESSARTRLRRLQDIWREPDHGIWEVRGPARHFTHSKVMAWVAFDRTIKACERFGVDEDLDWWQATRQEIHDEVCRLGFDAKLGSFVQSYGSNQLDASLLLIPLVGFLPPSDPRILATVQQIEKRLIRNGLVIRYDTEKAEDGLPAGEGMFLRAVFGLPTPITFSARIIKRGNSCSVC